MFWGRGGGDRPALPAQSPTFISGRVLDDARDEPVVEATVDLLAPGERVVRRSVTDEAGVFTVSFRGPATYRLRATRIGLAESLSAPLRLQPGETLQVILRMNIQAVALQALEVADRRAHPVARLEGFHYRSQRGFGGFIHREDIERRNPLVLSDMLPEHGIDAEGVESYRGAGSLPAEFGGYTARCGVIAIWTRTGTE